MWCVFSFICAARISIRRVVVAIGFVTASLASLPASAQTVIDWTGNGSSDAYNSVSNWAGFNVPNTVSETARFNAPASFDVRLQSLTTTTVSDLLILNTGSSQAVEFAAVSSTPAFYDVDDDLLVQNSNFLLNAPTGTGDVGITVGDELRVRSSSQLLIANGARIDAGRLSLANNTGGSAAVIVDGDDSQFNTTGFSIVNIGQASSGSLIYRNGATGTISQVLQLANFADSGNIADLQVSSGAELNLGALQVAPGGTNTFAQGRLTVEGASSVLNTTTVSIGGNSANNPVGEGTVSDGATLNASGAITVNQSGTLAVDGGGVTTAGGFDNTSGGSFDFSDGVFTVTGGSFAPVPFGNYEVDGADIADNPILEITGTTAADLTGSLTVGSSRQATLRVLGGGTIQSNGANLGFQSASNGSATVDGAASSWDAGELRVGQAGAGSLTISNGGLVESQNSRIAISGTATISISGDDGAGNSSTWENSGASPLEFGDSGGDTSLVISAGGKLVNNAAAVLSEATSANTDVTVTGVGSQWTNGSLVLGGAFIGDEPGGAATVTIKNEASLVAGRVTLYPQAELTLDGGTATFSSELQDRGGTFQFMAGQLNANSTTQTLIVTPSGMQVDSLSLNAPATIDAVRSLSFGGPAVVAAGGALVVEDGALSVGALTVATGGRFVHEGGMVSMAGPLLSAVGSTIDIAAGDLTLGSAAALNGVSIGGTLKVTNNVVTLLDANDVALDTGALVELGSNGSGTVVAANGLTLDFGGNITGFGTVDTPDDSATPLINNGNITGNSLAEPVTLSGYVKGVGTCDNCNITGTDAPGFSPATVNRGSVSYNGTLEIELGGTSTGDFDQLLHILGAGVADLGGTLDVDLINGFVPVAGDTFEIITAANVVDMFAVEELPGLGGLVWDVQYNSTSVVLAVLSPFSADFDQDGDVDADDLTQWQGDYATTGDSDADGDGDTDGADFLAWQSQNGAGGMAIAPSQSVPEPTTGWLIAISVTLLPALRDGASR